MARQTRKPKVKRRKGRRVVKTKKRFRRQRGGMYKTQPYPIPMDMYFPKNGYFEANKSEDYLKITNLIMSSLLSDHFEALVRRSDLSFKDLKDLKDLNEPKGPEGT